jgi:hypothetical protein
MSLIFSSTIQILYCDNYLCEYVYLLLRRAGLGLSHLTDNQSKGNFMIINNYSELLQGDKVRAKTPPEINQAIDIEIAVMIRFYASKTDYEISKRIEKLDNEWDIGRCIEGRAAIVSFMGVILGLKKSKK